MIFKKKFIYFKFYFLYLFTLFIFSFLISNDFITILNTIIFINLWSYLIHMFSHINMYKINFKYFIFGSLYNLHNLFHHNSINNRKLNYLVLEFFSNFWNTSFIYYYFIFRLFKIEFPFDITICILYGLLYGTYHLINQNLIKHNSHILHHKNNFNNFGPDFIDLIFNTKIGSYENMNSGIINIIIIFSIYYFFKKYLNKFYNK